MAFLTDQTFTTGVTLSHLIHVVDPFDTSQGNLAGSSYKATIGQVLSGFTGTTLYEVGSGTDSTQRIGTSNNSIGNYSVISGGFNNTTKGAASGIVSGTNNLLEGSGSIIGGGRGNATNTNYSSILGGCGNSIGTMISSGIIYGNSIGGGGFNTILGLSTTSDSYGNTIGGGNFNTIQPVLTGGQTISGGINNNGLSDSVTIGGGCNNTVLGLAGFVGGGGFNTVSGDRSVITGGGGSCTSLGNKTLCNYNFIGGGIQNVVNGTFSSIVGGGSISGGNGNTINSCYSTIIGGCRNVINHDFSTIIGDSITTQSACTVHINNLLITATPPQDQTATDYLVRDVTSGMIKYKTIPGPTVYGLFSQTGTSVAVSATTVESTLINGGIGTLSVPANGFQVGDSFNGVLIGHLSCVGTATLQIRIKTTTGVVLADTGAIPMNTTTNKHWKLDVNFTIRQLGVASVGSIASGGLFSYTKNSGNNFEGVNFSIINNTTFDTTISNTLLITAEWNTNNAGNSIYSEIFTLNKTY